MLKRRLLLADDSVTIQKVVNLTFADEGIEVIAVGDGDTAMKKFVELVPDLVMVDVNMPGASGFQICEIIKQDDETRHIPVILLVGSFEPFDEEEAKRVGADDFLTKPFQSIRQLVNKVSDLLNGNPNRTFGDAASNSFSDTLEMIPPAESAAVDDLIQTNQIGSLPADEAAKFETTANRPPSGEIFDSESIFETEKEIDTAAEISAENVSANDEFFSEENIAEAEVNWSETEPLPPHENIYEFADENFGEESESKEEPTAPEEIVHNVPAFRFNGQSETISANQNFASEETDEQCSVNEKFANKDSAEFEIVPIPELDDFDLLELNPSKSNRYNKIADYSERENDSNGAVAVGNLSPEAIDIIADRIVEKLSDKIVEKIVREVVAQINEKS